MRALTVTGENSIALIEIPKPIPLQEEALIRILRAGICATDIEIVRGYKEGFRHVLGHEFVGIVEAVNSSELINEVWTGKRVVGDINISCLNCSSCNDSLSDSSRRRNHCPHRQCLGIHAKNGTFAEYITLPLRNLHLVPRSMTDKQAALTEPIAAAYRIVEQGILKVHDQVAIVGDGKLGLLIADVLRKEHTQQKLTLIGKHPEKLQLVAEHINAVLYNDSNMANLENHFDVVIACTASFEGLQVACKLVRPMGTVVLKATCAENTGCSLNDVTVKEISVIGSRCGPYPPAMQHLLKNNEFVEKYVVKSFPFEEIAKAFEYAATPGVLKVQVVM